MQKNNASNEPLYLGIDGGGSKCRATLYSADGRLLGSGVAGAANPFQNMERAHESILCAANLALNDAGSAASLHGLVAGVGLAGVNLPEFYVAMNNWQHPFGKMYLTTDLHIACLGAHGGRDGAVIVAGTGTCAYAIVDGSHFSYGGHGFPLGDKGSGAWMGLEAIKSALLAHDNLGPETLLLPRICAHLETDHLGIVSRFANAKSTQYAQLAPLVIATAIEGDQVASNIIESGVEYLARLAERLHCHKPPRIALLGGLAQHLLPWLEKRLTVPLSKPEMEPDIGAIYYARTQSLLETIAP
ncbi:MAG: BadF/BadG/BcrA/BcrD ATPase family protein [Halioglobus sp.]